FFGRAKGIVHQPIKMSASGGPYHYGIARAYLVFTWGAGQFRISGQRGEAMSRYIYLRKYVDVTLFGILHNLANIVLGIVTTIVPARIGCRCAEARRGSRRLHAPGTRPGEFGIGVCFKAPALVGGQMPV